MAINIDSTRIDACNSDEFVAYTSPPEFSENKSFERLRQIDAGCSVMSLDAVYRVIEALDEHGGQRELGDLIDAIADLDMPLLLIEAMIDEELIQFVPGYPFDAAAPVMRIV